MKSEENKEYEEVLESMVRTNTLTDIEFIRKAREEGIEKGIEKGREEGREEGIEKGREEGMRLRDGEVNKLLVQMAKMQEQIDSFKAQNDNMQKNP